LRIVITDFDPNTVPAKVSIWHCLVVAVRMATT